MAKRMENEKEIAFPDTIPSFIGFRILIKKEENNYKKITIRKNLQLELFPGRRNARNVMMFNYF